MGTDRLASRPERQSNENATDGLPEAVVRIDATCPVALHRVPPVLSLQLEWWKGKDQGDGQGRGQ